MGNETSPSLFSKIYAEEGFALLAVLGFLLILSAILIPFASSARIRALTSGNQYDDARFELALNSVNAAVAMRLSGDRHEDDNGGLANLKPVGYSCSLGRGSLDIKVQQHSGLIDLNVASAELLQLGLGAAGVEPAVVRELGEIITQYRRMDGERPAAAPSAMVSSDGLKFAPFEDVAELYDFLPLRSIPLERLARVFTINSRSAVVTDSSLAPAIQAKRSSYPEAAKAIVATATQGADVVTIESAFQDGSNAYLRTDIYQLGASDRGVVRLINSLPSEIFSSSGSRPVANGCSQILDSKTVALLHGVFS